LRREEVAMLAGISSDYYLRLEQGRDRTPSVQVVEAIARVLQLGPDEATYLHALARPRPKPPRRQRREEVPAGTLRLLGSLPMPAFVQDRYLNVLAANPMAQALSPGMRPGVNRLLAAFLDPGERELHEDWQRSTAVAVGQLRSAMGTETDDSRMAALVGELSMKSDRFRRLWAKQDVVRPAGGPARMHHPAVGALELHREKLIVAGTENQILVIYHADPGTASAQALALLGTIAASFDPCRRRHDRAPRSPSPPAGHVISAVRRLGCCRPTPSARWSADQKPSGPGELVSGGDSGAA
jgi:transcriptional regulator with XRE-family HTH domain